MKLAILWASSDAEVIKEVIVPYIYRSIENGWWEEIRLIIWGPSEKILATEPILQDEILELKEMGVSIEACQQCANNYFVDNVLNDLGIQLKYMESELTEILKSDYKLITF